MNDDSFDWKEYAEEIEGILFNMTRRYKELNDAYNESEKSNRHLQTKIDYLEGELNYYKALERKVNI